MILYLWTGSYPDTWRSEDKGSFIQKRLRSRTFTSLCFIKFCTNFPHGTYLYLSPTNVLFFFKENLFHFNLMLKFNALPITYYVPHQFSSAAQSCPTLCNSMNRSTSGLPVHHQLPEFTQTHVHLVGDAIQPSHPFSSCPNPSQHRNLFQWVNSSHEVAKVLELQL